MYYAIIASIIVECIRSLNILRTMTFLIIIYVFIYLWQTILWSSNIWRMTFLKTYFNITFITFFEILDNIDFYAFFMVDCTTTFHGIRQCNLF